MGDGPIPARAGEPSARSLDACSFTGCDGFGIQGLSPLARGNLRGSACWQPLLGPIPARAGEPMSPNFSQWLLRAYPRSRGGTPERQTPTGTSRGLSPLARGNLVHLLGFPRLWGPIAQGLSPLARGNLGATLQKPDGLGPIPARAGEPNEGVGDHNDSGAYPRSRGGTTARALPVMPS